MLLQENIDELAMLETLDNGKPFKYARTSDLPQVCSNGSLSFSYRQRYYQMCLVQGTAQTGVSHSSCRCICQKICGPFHGSCPHGVISGGC